MCSSLLIQKHLHLLLLFLHSNSEEKWTKIGWALSLQMRYIQGSKKLYKHEFKCLAAVELTWLNIHHINLPLQTKISTLQFSFTLWTYLFCRSCTLREVTCDWFLNLFLEFFIILLKLFSTRLLPVFRCFNVTAGFNFLSIVKLYPLPLTKSLHLIVYLPPVLFSS